MRGEVWCLIAVATPLLVLSLLAWSGRWRRWADAPSDRQRVLLFPWCTASVLVFALSFALQPAGQSGTLPWWIGVLGGLPLILGLAVGMAVEILKRPRWALPPWYRHALAAADAAEAAREARRMRRHLRRHKWTAPSARAER